MNNKLALCFAHPVPCLDLLPLLFLLVVLAAVSSGAAYAEGAGAYTYSGKGGSFAYSVKKTGENFSFEFERNPGRQNEKLSAALDLLQTVYGDASIDPRQDRFFMKETAKCFVFNGTWYTYTSCFLPNEYSPGNAERFWGFVYRVPNGMWLITRNLLPALAFLGLSWFFLRSRG